MITQAARLSARHQVGHLNTAGLMSRGTRSLFIQYNGSRAGTRMFVMPPTPVQPDPVIPDPTPHMFTYKLYKRDSEALGGTPALASLAEFLSQIGIDLISAAWNGEYYSIQVDRELLAENLMYSELQEI